MRSMLVCAAICVCSPINTIEHQFKSQDSLAPSDALAMAAPGDADESRAESFHARFQLSSADVFEPGSLFAAAAFVPDAVVEADTAAADADPEPPRTFSKHELCSTAVSVAEANNLPALFFANLIQQESGFRPDAVSPAGAQGIAQFMPRVAAAYGVPDPFDPISALHASGRFLSELRAQFGNLGLAAAAYNAGPKRVQDWMARRGKLPAETRQYVRNITGRPAEHWVKRRGVAAQSAMPLHARCQELRAIAAEAAVRTAPPRRRSAVKLAALKRKTAAPKSMRIASR